MNPPAGQVESADAPGEPQTPESLRSRLWRLFFNLFPAYRRTGGRVTHLAHDWSEVLVRVPLNWKTRNYVGTLYGGSMYGAVDPVYMIMLIQRLGPDYVVWDKSATIRFRKPGRDTLYARFSLPDAELDAIRGVLETEPKVDRTYTVELVDQAGELHAEVEKVVHISSAIPKSGK